MLSKLSSKLGSLILLLFLSTLLHSCGYLVLARKTKFVSPTEDVSLSISESEDGPYEKITTEKIKLNHFKKKYFIKMEKNGFVGRTHEITRTTKNRLKRLDIVLLMQTGVFATIFTPVHFLTQQSSGTTHSLGQQIALFSALGIGVAGWGAVIPCPGYIFPKTVELPKLIPILTKDSSQLALTVGKNEFRLNKKGIRVRDYENMKEFKNGYGYTNVDSLDSFDDLAETDLYPVLANLLEEAEYWKDSSKAEMNNTLKLDAWVRSVVFNRTEGKLRCEARISWALETLDELQYLYDKNKHGESEWRPFNEDSLSNKEQRLEIENAFAEAVDFSFKKFLAMDTIQAILNAPVPIPLMEEDTIDLNTGTEFCSSVSEAVKSVVTVVSKKGHGSGCIVTPNGYIITNAHVVEKDTSDLKIILGSDVKNKIPVKLVRMNEPVDLALLKLDSSGLKPLKIADMSQIETGTDAYAIGTPADIDLGQTVTRGIVSGKRKFGGHQLIQTDVAISPGNSGGALIKPDGLLMGIVTSSMDGKEINDIGFAVPAPLIESALKINLNQ